MNTCDTTFSTCENNPGSYYCIPHVGFMLGPNNEIVGEGDSYSCTMWFLCFMTHDESSVKDIDECNHPSINCHKNARCLNTQGAYKCICKSGFKGDGVSICNTQLKDYVICVGKGCIWSILIIICATICQSPILKCF